MTKLEQLRNVTQTSPLLLGRLEENEKKIWSSLVSKLNREEPRLKTKLGLKTDDGETFVIVKPKKR